MTENIITLDRDQRLIERIEQLMANPPEGSVVLEITPGVARHALQYWLGTHNRREKPAAIQRYQTDIATGNWHLNGSTVVFTDQHLLGDGQNRLKACIRADRPLKTHVVFGVPHEYFYSMDQGRARSPIDVLEIEGVPHPGDVKQAVRWAELIRTKPVGAPTLPRTTFSSPDILKLYRESYRDVADFRPEARAIYRERRQPVGMVMALLYYFDKKDPELAADFAASWAGGPYEARFQAISTMEIEVERIRRNSNGRVHDVVRAAMVINAWNAVRGGKKGRNIRWEIPPKDRAGVPFPDIM
jgi:hypothetical protein